MKTLISRTSVALAAAALAMSIAACTVHVDDKDKDAKKVDIQTPLANLKVDTSEGATDNGIPVYPGATPRPESGGDKHRARLSERDRVVTNNRDDRLARPECERPGGRDTDPESRERPRSHARDDARECCDRDCRALETGRDEVADHFGVTARVVGPELRKHARVAVHDRDARSRRGVNGEQHRATPVLPSGRRGP